MAMSFWHTESLFEKISIRIAQFQRPRVFKKVFRSKKCAKFVCSPSICSGKLFYLSSGWPHSRKLAGSMKRASWKVPTTSILRSFGGISMRNDPSSSKHVLFWQRKCFLFFAHPEAERNACLLRKMAVVLVHLLGLWKAACALSFQSFG